MRGMLLACFWINVYFSIAMISRNKCSAFFIVKSVYNPAKLGINFLKGLDTQAINVIVGHAAKAPSPHSAVAIEQFSGAP